MSHIGIIANPASGKDIRRLVSYATTIDNQEKVNIVKRIVLASQAMGVDDIVFMPDTFQIGNTVADDLTCDGRLTAHCQVLNMPLTASQADTTHAASLMESMGVGCIVVLGGDGTSRAAAKGLVHTPLLPLSTGTNNVYPTMIEGTVAGMAAAAITKIKDPNACCTWEKRIEVSINGVYADMALVDAVISDTIFSGSKAIWDIDRIRYMLVARCHPASIGFSSIAACLEVVKDVDDWGLSLELSKQGTPLLAPVAAGMLCDVHVSNVKRLPLNKSHTIHMTYDGMVALDGERECKVWKDDTLSFCIARKGPWRVKVRETLEMAMQEGMFLIKK